MTGIPCPIVLNVTDALLSDMVSKIVKHFHPDKVILFGSRTGEHDLDLLVIMDVDSSPIRKAAEICKTQIPANGYYCTRIR